MKRSVPRLKVRSTKPEPISILDAVHDPNLFREAFRSIESWQAWECFLAVLFGHTLSAEQLALFQRCTGRTQPRPGGYQEAWLCIGRRGGKSFTLALIACYLAALRDWRPYLAVGEMATIPIIAADRRQARVCMRYIRGLLKGSPLLSKLIVSEQAESITLSTRCVIEVHTASYRTTRGYTIAAALCDEIAFWSTDEGAAEPDREIIAALRPAMATVAGSMMLCSSSPYARKGALWDAHRRHFARDDSPILVWQASTQTMNPRVPAHVIEEAYEQDPVSAAAEYGAQFRSDIESFIAREAVESCVASGVYERPPMTDVTYSAFVDPSGGSADSFTCAIGHKSPEGIIVVDCVRCVKPPFSPEQVCFEMSNLLKTYGITKVQGDRYAGLWPVEQFQKHGIEYEQSAKAKSDMYSALLPVLNSRQVELLDNKALVSEICSLERRTARGGRDSIDHPPGQHDDRANACAGLCAQFTLNPSKYREDLSWVGGPDQEEVPFCRPRSAWGAIRFC